MISVNTKIHDKFTLEFKVSFKARRNIKINDFSFNTWIFVPHSLDMTAQTYTRQDFYKDIRTNIRLITPVFLLRDIANAATSPLCKLEQAMHQMASLPTRSHSVEYEYQIKMFAAIYKSSMRDQLLYIFQKAACEDRLLLMQNFVADVNTIITRYRTLSNIIKTPTVSEDNFNYFQFGDEFIANITEKEFFRILTQLDNPEYEVMKAELTPIIIRFLEHTKTYKTAHNYQCVMPESENRNSDLIFRLGALKKYIESDLFLHARKKRDGVLAEQVLYSLAAGLSMVFATAVAFSFQLKYGNFTMPFFVALVVSYMLKDRIKEFTRYYFAHKMSPRYFDNKTNISIKDIEIGWSKEGFDFIAEQTVPKQVLDARNRIPLIQAENRYAKEKIILFRKHIRIDRNMLDQSSDYNIEGVVEIIRFNVSSFLKKMDNPEIPLYAFDENNRIARVMGAKNYYLNIIFQYNDGDNEVLTRYRVGFNREGVKSIEKKESI